MAIYGRALHQQARDDAAETPERVAERIRTRQACDLGLKDREAKFPMLTKDNAAEAIRYQEERIRHYLGVL